MNTKNMVIGVAVVIAVIAALYFLLGKGTDNMAPVTSGDVDETQTGDMARVEENAVVATEQKPGNSVAVAQLVLAAPGYVVIHEDNNGAPGTILGSSALLQAGQSDKVEVALNRATKDGEKLHAMLHSEMNNNTTFEAASDTPVQSRFGGPISGWFEVSTTAEESVEVTL